MQYAIDLLKKSMSSKLDFLRSFDSLYKFDSSLQDHDRLSIDYLSIIKKLELEVEDLRRAIAILT